MEAVKTILPSWVDHPLRKVSNFKHPQREYRHSLESTLIPLIQVLIKVAIPSVQDSMDSVTQQTVHGQQLKVRTKMSEAISPTSKKLTGLAFTYNPPTVEDVRPTTVTTPSQPPPTSFSTPAISSLARKSPTAASRTSVSPRPSPVTRKSMEEARKAFLEESYS